MACGLLGAPPRAGAVTSGGTESIFLAVQVARDEARQPGHRRAAAPHPVHRAPGVREGGEVPRRRADPRPGRRRRSGRRRRHRRRDRRRAPGSSSAPRPATRTASSTPSPTSRPLAAERGVLFHTDACLGGWLLPWWERLGEPVAAVGLPGPRRHVASRPTSTSTATRSRARRSSLYRVPGPARAPVLLVRRLARRPVRLGHPGRHPARAARSRARGPPSTTSAPTATCAWRGRSSRPPPALPGGHRRHRRRRRSPARPTCP